MKGRLACGLGAALALAVAAAGVSVVAVTAANAAVIGTMTITLGVTNSIAPDFVTSAACPAPSTNYYVTFTGAGAPPNTNAVGSTSIAVPGAPITANLGCTWEDWATTVGVPLPLNGTAGLDLVCTDQSGSQNFGEFLVGVRFTPEPTISPTSSRYMIMPFPTGTPSPTPTPPPTPTPTVTPTPTATPTPTPTPTVIFQAKIKICGVRLTVTIYSDGTVTYDPPLSQVLQHCGRGFNAAQSSGGSITITDI